MKHANPILVREGQHIWYFDQELITSWYDLCVSSGRAPYNPLTRTLLPFQSRDDIVVDRAAKKFIESRLQYLATRI